MIDNKDREWIKNEIRRASIQSVIGGNVTPTGSGLLLQIKTPLLLARVTGATRIGATANRWTYDIIPVQIKADGTSADTGVAGKALNLCEINNPADGTGLHGNGVDNSAADWPAGYEIMPAPDYLIVAVYEAAGVTDISYVFEHCNGVDGSCA